MRRTLFALCLALSACHPSTPTQELNLKPGNRHTFFAAAGDIQSEVNQPATATEPEFKYKVRVSPTKGISIGTAVGDEGQGDLSENKLFTPASITKVITAAVALKLLGPDFQFHTRVYWFSLGDGSAKDLTIVADGDPLVTRERLRWIGTELKKKGITRLTGHLNLVSADKRKDHSYPAFGFDKEDYWSCYGSRTYNFNLLRNCASVFVTGWGQARWGEADISAPLSFDPVRRDGTRLAFAFDRATENAPVRGYVITGAPAKASGIALPVLDTKGWYGNVLLSELKRAGIQVAALTPSRD